MPVTLALSTLCENPRRRTGLSTFFHEFIAHARAEFPQVKWLVFAGRDEPWPKDDPGLTVVRCFSSNERPLRRLLADQFLVAGEAARRGAGALLTVGFFPLRDAGLPVVMHVFEVNHRSGAGVRAWYRRTMVDRGLRLARQVVVNSEWTRSRLGSVAAPTIVSYEGLQHDRFRPAGPAGAAGLPATYLLWASNFYDYKRCDRALAAFASLPAALRARYPLVLIGGNWNGGKERAEAVARDLGIAGETHFLGWVEDSLLPDLYRGARLHLLSSESETFGRCVLEAMACGCVNVLQDLAVFHEVASNAAVYVDFGEPAVAARAIERLCGDDALWQAKREAGLARAAAFTFRRLVRERVPAILAALEVPAR